MLIFTKMNEQQIRIGNKVAGLGMIVFGGIIGLARGENNISNLNNLFLSAGGALFATEGLGDLITGQHHYVSSKITNYFIERRNIRYLL